MNFNSKKLLVIIVALIVIITACEPDGSGEEKKNRGDEQKYEKEIEENALEEVPDSL